MPRKRNFKQNKETDNMKKQKTAIVSRLMEISLKVDDYVYEDIPISPKKAVLFIKEVNGYKEKCVGDKRSLQVIEKLDRCMRGIINEQNESQSCSSDVINKCSVNLNYDSHNQSNALINNQHAGNERIILDDDDADNIRTILTDEHNTCNQRNILIDEHDASNKINIHVDKDDASNIRNILIDKYDTSNQRNVLVDEHEATNQRNILVDKLDASNKTNILVDEYNAGKQKNILTDKHNTGNQRNILINEYDSSNKRKVLDKVDAGNQKNILLHKRSARNQTNISDKPDTSKHRNILKEKPTNNAICDQNDLSWIENLRYVREISAEERIPVYYQDSFWESHTLPNDWNDEMFQ